MKRQSTQILSLVALLALSAAAFSFARMSGARDDATAQKRELDLARADLADIAGMHAGPMTAPPSAGGDPELNRRLRTAATEAGVSDQLSSIEPGQPSRVRDSDFLETPVFVRLDKATLRQLTTMLATLESSDRSIRVKAIECAPPAAQASPADRTAEEHWATDLTVSYLVFAPRR